MKISAKNQSIEFRATVQDDCCEVTKLTELLGWYGMLALIGGYFLVSFGYAEAEGVVFQLLNLTGGIALVVFALSKKATQLAILNIFWALIGVLAIARFIF